MSREMSRSLVEYQVVRTTAPYKVELTSLACMIKLALPKTILTNNSPLNTLKVKRKTGLSM